PAATSPRPDSGLVPAGAGGKGEGPEGRELPALPAPAAPPPVEAQVWNLDDGRQRAALSGHQGEVVTLAFAPDGKHLATTSRVGVVQLWESPSFRRTIVPTGR